MELFSERQFASSRYRYVPRNAKERGLVARCEQLRKRLRPVASYRHEASSVALHGDLPDLQALQKLLALLEPSRAATVAERAITVLANFWQQDGPATCDPNADYAQARILTASPSRP